MSNWQWGRVKKRRCFTIIAGRTAPFLDSFRHVVSTEDSKLPMQCCIRTLQMAWMLLLLAWLRLCSAQTAYIIPSLQQDNPSNHSYAVLGSIITDPALSKFYDTVMLTTDYRVQPNRFPWDEPAVLGRNLTIMSANYSTRGYRLFELEFATNRLLIPQGMSLTLKDLALGRSRKTAGQGLPFFVGQGVSSFLILDNVVRIRTACAHNEQELVSALQSITWHPPGGLRPLYEHKQQAELVQEYVFRNTTYYENIHATDVRYFVGPVDVPDTTYYAGYSMVQVNTTRICETYVSDECVAQRGADTCVMDQINALTAVNAPPASPQGGDTPVSVAAIVVPSVIGALLLAGTAAAALLLLRRHRRRRPRHSSSTSLLPVSIKGGGGPSTGGSGPLLGGLEPSSSPSPAADPTILPGPYSGADGSIEALAIGSRAGSWQLAAFHTAPEFEDATPHDKLKLGVLLGAGSFARVYKGTWRHVDVAVKVLQHDSSTAAAISNEVDLVMSFRHENIVAAYYFVTWTRASSTTPQPASQDWQSSSPNLNQPARVPRAPGLPPVAEAPSSSTTRASASTASAAATASSGGVCSSTSDTRRGSGGPFMAVMGQQGRGCSSCTSPDMGDCSGTSSSSTSSTRNGSTMISSSCDAIAAAAIGSMSTSLQSTDVDTSSSQGYAAAAAAAATVAAGGVLQPGVSRVMPCDSKHSHRLTPQPSLVSFVPFMSAPHAALTTDTTPGEPLLQPCSGHGIGQSLGPSSQSAPCAGTPTCVAADGQLYQQQQQLSMQLHATAPEQQALTVIADATGGGVPSSSQALAATSVSSAAGSSSPGLIAASYGAAQQERLLQGQLAPARTHVSDQQQVKALVPQHAAAQQQQQQPQQQDVHGLSDSRPPATLLWTSSTGSSWEAPSSSSKPNSRARANEAQTWLIFEYCDGGTLMDLLAEGGTLGPHVTGRRRMAQVLTLLLDIAAGMSYLHSRNVLHGDLKPVNVLIKHVQGAPYCRMAKVSDFGLSRALQAGQSHRSTRTFGTLNHTPPELLRLGRLSPAGDVYAFGIMMWEAFTGQIAFSGQHYGEIFEQVALLQRRPDIPPDMPPEYAELVRQCWAADLLARPPFASVMARLEELLSSLMQDEVEAQERFVSDL